LSLLNSNATPLLSLRFAEQAKMDLSHYNPFSLLSDDLVIAIFLYFASDQPVSSSQLIEQGQNTETVCSNLAHDDEPVWLLVDEKSLRNLALTNKRLHRVAESPALWRRINSRTAQDNAGKQSFRPFDTHLHLVKHDSTELSFIAYTKLETLQTLRSEDSIPQDLPNTTLSGSPAEYGEWAFLSREKATGITREIRVLAKIDLADHPPIRLVRELFVSHFLLAHRSPDEESTELIAPDMESANALQLPLSIIACPDVLLRTYNNVLTSTPAEITTGMTRSFELPAVESLQGRSELFSLVSDCDSVPDSFFRMKHLLRLEESQLPFRRKHRHHNQHHPLNYQINHEHRWQRAQLADWLLEIVQVFDLDSSLVFRVLLHAESVHLSDLRPISQRQGIISGILLFYSMTQSTQLSVWDILHCTDNKVSPVELGNYFMSTLICCTRCPQYFCFPTVSDFLDELIVQINQEGSTLSESTIMMMRYISELSAMTLIDQFYSPSEVASAIYVLAHYACACGRVNDIRGSDNDSAGGITTEKFLLWPDQLAAATGHRWLSLGEIVLCLSRMIHDVQQQHPELFIAQRRYRSERRHGVANQGVPVIASLETLTRFHERHLRHQEERSTQSNA